MALVHSWNLVDPHGIDAGSNFHALLIDLCDAIRGDTDIDLVNLVMGGARAEEIASVLGENVDQVKGRIKRLRRAVA